MMKSVTAVMFFVLVLTMVVLNHQEVGAQSAVCSLPAKTGYCRARIIRYYYNSSRGDCFEFVYGGCGSNGNNFRSRAACRAACQRPF